MKYIAIKSQNGKYLKDGIRYNLIELKTETNTKATVYESLDEFTPIVAEQASGQNNRQKEIDEKKLQKAKEIKKQEIAATRQLVETGGILFNGQFIRTDRQTQERLIQAAFLCSLNSDFKTDWKMYDGTFKELDAQQLTALALAVSEHVKAQFSREKFLVDKVEKATTLEEVENISWDYNE